MGGREPGCPRAGCLLLFSPGRRLRNVRRPSPLPAVTARESPQPAGPPRRLQGLAGTPRAPASSPPRQGHPTAWRCARAPPAAPAGSPRSTAESPGLQPARCPVCARAAAVGSFPPAALAPFYRPGPAPSRAPPRARLIPHVTAVDARPHPRPQSAGSPRTPPPVLPAGCTPPHLRFPVEPGTPTHRLLLLAAPPPHPRLPRAPRARLSFWRPPCGWARRPGKRGPELPGPLTQRIGSCGEQNGTGGVLTCLHPA